MYAMSCDSTARRRLAGYRATESSKVPTGSCSICCSGKEMQFILGQYSAMRVGLPSRYDREYEYIPGR